ncbi:MAG: lysophospholipid acyltransferase family protein [Verrucomicrobia bacterium]|nr:lysophospholipid acyltransferase family protein [Verrucomicrobiota bacterium]
MPHVSRTFNKLEKLRDAHPMRAIRHAVENLLLRLALAVLPRLERPTLLRLARALGSLGWLLARHSRRVALANTQVVFGRLRPDLAKQSFHTFALTTLETFWSKRLNADSMAELVEIDPTGWQRAQDALARGKGGIAINLHFSNWEMMGAALAYRGMKVNYIAAPMKNPFADRTLNALRQASGLQTIWRRGAAKNSLRALHRGEVISMMMDINVKPTDGGVWVDYCGLPVSVSGLSALLAKRTGAPIMGAVCHSLSDGRYRVVIGPEIPYQPDEDVSVITQRIMKFAENALREKPEDWWWVYKRWKYRPVGTALPYPFYSKPAPESRHQA